MLGSPRQTFFCSWKGTKISAERDVHSRVSRLKLEKAVKSVLRERDAKWHISPQKLEKFRLDRYWAVDRYRGVDRYSEPILEPLTAVWPSAIAVHGPITVFFQPLIGPWTAIGDGTAIGYHTYAFQNVCVSCTHVRACIHVFDHCGCVHVPGSVYLHICTQCMDVSILPWMSLRMFLFSGYIQGTILELFSVWLICHVFSEFLLNFQNWKREKERKGQRGRVSEGGREGGRGRERERERESRAGWIGGGGGRREKAENEESCEKKIQELTYWHHR